MHGVPGEAFPAIAVVEPLEKIGQSTSGFGNVKVFLRRFGYLEQDYPAKGDELTDEMSAALRRYQTRHALPVTAVFDEETRAQMTTSRCGLPDLQPDGPTIRFAAACPWDRMELTYAFDAGTSDIPGEGEFEAVRAAFQTWQFDTPLSFAEIVPTDNPDIMVGWRPTMDPDLDMTGAAIAPC